MLKSVPLIDGSIIILLSTGPLTITPETYNYNKLVKALPTATEQQVLELLVSPSYPDGVFRLLTHADLHYVNHISTTVNNHYIFHVETHSFEQRSTPTPTNASLLGVYTSFEEIFADFPELLL